MSTTQAESRSTASASTDRPLRVVHLVSTLNIGGLEKVVYDLVRLADPDRQTVNVICLGEVGALGGDFEAQGIAVEGLHVINRGTLRSVRALMRRLRDLRPDVLHTHNITPHFVGGLAARLAWVPVVVHTKHGRNYPEIRRKVLVNRFASWLSDRVVPVSGDAADVAIQIEKVPESKVEVIRNGIDLDLFPQAPRPIRGTVRRAIHVARLIYPTKDQNTLLKAVRLVADVEPNFVLDIVGDGPHRQFLENLSTELNLGKHLNFLGFRSDVHQLLAAAEFFVLSSVKEGLSITLLEAMATGLPIVATRVGGNPEVVADGETGLLAPVGNPEALAEAMLTLLRDPQRADQMGAAGRQRVEEHFDLRKVAGRYDALYRSLLARSRR